MTEHKESSVLARFASPLLILATIIWGSSFVVMKSSVDVLPTFWLLAIRFSFAALVLAVVFIRRWKVLDKQYLIGGTVMGFCLFSKRCCGRNILIGLLKVGHPHYESPFLTHGRETL